MLLGFLTCMRRKFLEFHFQITFFFLLSFFFSEVFINHQFVKNKKEKMSRVEVFTNRFLACFLKFFQSLMTFVARNLIKYTRAKFVRYTYYY